MNLYLPSLHIFQNQIKFSKSRQTLINGHTKDTFVVKLPHLNQSYGNAKLVFKKFQSNQVSRLLLGFKTKSKRLLVFRFHVLLLYHVIPKETFINQMVDIVCFPLRKHCGNRSSNRLIFREKIIMMIKNFLFYMQKNNQNNKELCRMHNDQ